MVSDIYVSYSNWEMVNDGVLEFFAAVYLDEFWYLATIALLFRDFHVLPAHQ